MERLERIVVGYHRTAERQLGEVDARVHLVSRAQDLVPVEQVPSYGFSIRPRNKTMPVCISRMPKRNGWSARNCGTGETPGAPAKVMATPVAAAASVPSSFTSTKALWVTW